MRRDLRLREKVVVAPLIALLLVLGFYPKPVTRRDQPGGPGHHARTSASTDPAPTVAAVQEAAQVSARR